MKKFLSYAAVIFCLFMSTVAFAASMSLTEAKNAGLVGERDNGLVGAVFPNASADIMELVNTTNSGRMVVYQETAAKQNIPLATIREIAGQKLLDLASSGQYIFVNGQWAQKK